MSLKRKIIVFVVAVFGASIALVFSGMLAGCSSGSSSAPVVANPTVVGTGTTDETMGSNGVRKDIEVYINTAYPSSVKKRMALLGYAKALQTAYTQVTNQTEAINMEPKIISALACVGMMGESSSGSNAPSRIIGKKISNTPERLAAQLKYEEFLDGKVFTISSGNDTLQSVCDFDPNVLPN